MDFEILAARKQLEIAQKRSYPDITLELEWIQTDKSDMRGIDDNGKDPLIAMLSINLPIWPSKNRAIQRQASARESQTRYRRMERENEQVARCLELVYDIEDNQRKIDLYKDALIPQARQLNEASENAYKAGTVDFLALIDAERMLLKYGLDSERAQANYCQKLAELEFLLPLNLNRRVIPMKKPIRHCNNKGHLSGLAQLGLVLIVGAAFALGFGIHSRLMKPAEAIHSDSSSKTDSEQIWTCSMHPTVRKNGPGKCPFVLWI